MQWYKHDANAHGDAKLRRVRIKYGMEGYGLYWYCLELIAANVEAHNLTFELEHDAEIIAHDTGIHYERVQEMMTYMVGQGLFEQERGVITCRKMLKRLDQSMTSNPKMRKLIDEAKRNHDAVMIPPDSVMQEENRRDKNRRDKNRGGPRKRAPDDFEVTVQMYEWAESEVSLPADVVNAETSAFKDHEFKNAKKDWPAVWRNWMRRAAQWRKENPGRKRTYAEQLAEDLRNVADA